MTMFTAVAVRKIMVVTNISVRTFAAFRGQVFFGIFNSTMVKTPCSILLDFMEGRWFNHHVIYDEKMMMVVSDLLNAFTVIEKRLERV